MRSRYFDRRSFGIIAAAALIGAMWAGFNLWRVGDSREPAVFHALIWIVFATPLTTFCGWVWARPRERWMAAFTCFAVYFFAIFAAARVERLVVGEDAAAAASHALYFRLALAFDLVGCLGAALQRGRSPVTIPAPNQPAARTTPPKP